MVLRMSNKQKCIDVCNGLLRGELSAVETYTQAIEKFKDHTACHQLEKIRGDHEQSAAVLRQHLLDMGAEPAKSSGAWGMFAQAVEGGAKLFGESAALQALIEGEEHGEKEYDKALKELDVMEEIKMEIHSSLMPRLGNHIVVLLELKSR